MSLLIFCCPIFLYLLVGDTENIAKVLRIIETEAIMRNIFFVCFFLLNIC